MPVNDYFLRASTRTVTHSWTMINHDPSVEDMDGLAVIIADLIMRLKCRGCPQYYDAWKQSASGVQPLSGAAKAAVEAFVALSPGTPNNPKPPDHLEGFVAEHLWYFLSLEDPSEVVVRIEPPGFAATDPGGDGLIIHRMPDGCLMFRLWEIKKCTGNSPIDRTVDRACNQLHDSATEYLARYTSIGQEVADPELSDFFGRLIELWIDTRKEAAAGVSVAASSHQITGGTCFNLLVTKLPGFVQPARLKGMLMATEDFPLFCEKVRERIWSGL